MDQLAQVSPAVAIAHADAHSLRGTILAPNDAREAEHEFASALDLFASMASNPALAHSPTST